MIHQCNHASWIPNLLVGVIALVIAYAQLRLARRQDRAQRRDRDDSKPGDKAKGDDKPKAEDSDGGISAKLLTGLTLLAPIVATLLPLGPLKDTNWEMTLSLAGIFLSALTVFILVLRTVYGLGTLDYKMVVWSILGAVVYVELCSVNLKHLELIESTFLDWLRSSPPKE